MAAQERSERAPGAWAVLVGTVKTSDLYNGLLGLVRPIATARAGQHYVLSEPADALPNPFALHMSFNVVESLTIHPAKAGLPHIMCRSVPNLAGCDSEHRR